MRCPNCNTPADSDFPCRVCGYAPELAREFLWLYLGGVALCTTGFAIGAFGVFIEGSGPDHWSRALIGWYPLAPWPSGHHWLSFLVVGILLTMSGLAITRRRKGGWLTALLLTLYQVAWIGAALAGAVSTEASGTKPIVPMAIHSSLLLLLVRIGAALRRTPVRDAVRMQTMAQELAGPEGAMDERDENPSC